MEYRERYRSLREEIFKEIMTVNILHFMKDTMTCKHDKQKLRTSKTRRAR